MTGEGVARASWLEKRHLPQYVRPLIREGQIRERIAHIEDRRQRRKVHDLTDSGRVTATRLRRKLETQTVRVRDATEVRERTVAQVLQDAGGDASLLDIVRQIGQVGTLDFAHLKAAPPTGFVEMLWEAPPLRSFVGRRHELEAVIVQADRPRMFIVRGVAGIGKSCFGAKACEILRGKRNLFWHRIRPWDTLQSVLASLSNFLLALGRPGLKAVVGRGESSRASEVLREDLPGTHSFLVFDDAHEGGTQVLSFFRILKEALADAGDVRVLVLTRRALPFYTRRDIVIGGFVEELALPGLSSEDLAILLSAEGGDQGLIHISRKLGGLPLALELVRSAGHGTTSRSLQDLHRFLEETILRELSDAGRKMMKAASLYRVPMPREALFVDSSLTHEVLLDLEDRSLIRVVGDGRCEVHDTIRDFFSGVLTPSERRQFGDLAVKRLRELASKAREAGNLVACVDFLSNALNVTASSANSITLWEALGDVKRQLGDLPACLEAFKEAENRTRDPELLARLHWKRASVLRGRGAPAQALSEVEAGVRALGDHRSPERGWLDLLKSSIVEQETWEESRKHAEAALRVFQEFRVLQGQGKALLQLGWIELHSPEGDRSRAEQYHATALDISRRLSDPEFSAQVHLALAHMYAWHLAEVEKALAHIAEVKILAGASGDLELSFAVLFDEAEVNLELLADYATAEAQFKEVESRGRRLYKRGAGPISEFNLALSLYFQNRVPEARERFEQVVKDIGPLDPFWQLRSMWMVAECCLMQGDLEGLRRVANAFHTPRISKLAEGAGIAALPVPASILRGLRCLLNGDRARAGTAFTNALRLAEQASRIHEAPALSWAYLGPFFYGIAVRVMGKDPEATEHIRHAAEILRTYGMRARLSFLSEQERRMTKVFRQAYRVAWKKPV